MPGTEPVNKILDHGQLQLLDFMGSDLDVVNAAKVSFSAYSTEMNDASIGLINFLMKNKHATPFEHCVFKFYVKSPIFVAREWFRHRWSSFNEMSMRYHVPQELHFYFPSPENIRTQVGKPGNYSFEPISDPEVISHCLETLQSSYEVSNAFYRVLLEKGVAKEIARSVLPVGQYTEFIWTVNARSLINFISLRNESNAQYEIQQYAEVVENIFAEKMPYTHQAFVQAGREAI
jgi:thymidylate synthase (FAD)